MLCSGVQKVSSFFLLKNAKMRKTSKDEKVAMKTNEKKEQRKFFFFVYFDII